MGTFSDTASVWTFGISATVAEAAAAEPAAMKSVTPATETAAAKTSAAMEAATAKTSGVSPVEKKWRPHQSCGQTDRRNEFEG
jgi:hypothetical protein